MNNDNGAFQQGMFSGNWSNWNALQSAGRYANMGRGSTNQRSPAWLIGLVLGLFLGALSGAKAGGILGIVFGAFVGAALFAALFAAPKLIWKAASFTIGRTIKIFRHEKI